MANTVTVFKRFVWEIPDFTEECAKMQNSTRKESSPITIKINETITEWSISIYPNGNNGETKNYLSVFLNHHASLEQMFSCEFKFTALQKFGKRLSSTRSSYPGSSFIHGLGYPTLLSHASLFDKSKSFLVNDVLTLECEINITAECRQKTHESFSLGPDARKMFEKDAFADIEFVMNDGIVLKAHKVILAARSPCFYEKFKNESKEVKKSVLKIATTNSKIMKEVLKFIYYGEVESLDEISRELILYADEVKLENLKKICIPSIIKTLTLDNVIETILLSESIEGLDVLYHECTSLIARCHEAICSSQKWEKLKKETITKIAATIIKSSVFLSNS